MGRHGILTTIVEHPRLGHRTLGARLAEPSALAVGGVDVKIVAAVSRVALGSALSFTGVVVSTKPGVLVENRILSTSQRVADLGVRGTGGGEAATVTRRFLRDGRCCLGGRDHVWESGAPGRVERAYHSRRPQQHYRPPKTTRHGGDSRYSARSDGGVASPLATLAGPPRSGREGGGGVRPRGGEETRGGTKA